MKIIKRGKPQKGWAKKFKCTGNGNGGGGCGATLLVEATDLYHTFSSHYDGSNETYTTFTCAACGVETDINDSPQGMHANKTAWKRYKTKHDAESDTFYNDHY